MLINNPNTQIFQFNQIKFHKNSNHFTNIKKNNSNLITIKLILLVSNNFNTQIVQYNRVKLYKNKKNLTNQTHNFKSRSCFIKINLIRRKVDSLRMNYMIVLKLMRKQINQVLKRIHSLK